MGTVGAFFEEFLPAHLGDRALAGMEQLSTTFRFAVEGEGGGDWLCRLREGRLAGVERRGGAGEAEFAYRMGVGAFFEIVGALTDPQDVFLEGRAHVEGDVEKALKMGMILHQFNREHPYFAGPEAEGRFGA